MSDWEIEQPAVGQKRKHDDSVEHDQQTSTHVNGVVLICRFENTGNDKKVIVATRGSCNDIYSDSGEMSCHKFSTRRQKFFFYFFDVICCLGELIAALHIP